MSNDDDLNGESNSITNQKARLKKYADDHGFRCTEYYVDDGVSGTTFNRAGFQKMIADIKAGKVGTVIVKDMSRFGRDYLKVGYYTEVMFAEYDVHFIAVNDGVDSELESNDFTPIRNLFNEFYARDTSKKIRAVFNAKGKSGKPLTVHPPYGYKKSEADKTVWEVDEETAPVVKRIFQLCIEGYGPLQIAKALTSDKILTPTAYQQSKKSGNITVEKPYRWAQKTIVGILEKLEYVGHTVNFKTHRKSYKHKKKLKNPREEWLIFENTHEPIISQHDFDLVQEIRNNKRKIQKHGEINLFSGMVYCADCGAKMYLCRSRSLNEDQEHLKCSTYAHDKTECSAHYIRTVVLRELVFNELNRLLDTVHQNEDKFVDAAMEYASTTQSQEVKKAKKMLAQSEKRISELDRLFTRLYEDNVSGKVSDERFEQMSANYDNEQKQLKQTVKELITFIEQTEQKTADISNFIHLVRRYTYVNELTPEIMHELIDKIVVHAPDKSSGHRQQKVEIHFRFNVATAEAVLDRRDYDKRGKAA